MRIKTLTNDFIKTFTYDLNSPSHLSWNIDIYCGKYNNVQVIKNGSHCDHISKTTNRYVVMYNGSNYQVSRIVYFINFPEMDQSLMVDHIDGNPLNNEISNLRLVSNILNARNTKKRDGIEITGVRFRIVNGHGYWHSRYQNLEKKTIEKTFSCLILGFDKAKELAILFRQTGIANQNLNGAGYTERHGK